MGYFESLRSIRPHASSIIPTVISSWLCRGHPAERPHSFPSPSVIVNSVCPAACQPENPKADNPLPNMIRRAANFFMSSYHHGLCYAAVSAFLLTLLPKATAVFDLAAMHICVSGHRKAKV